MATIDDLRQEFDAALAAWVAEHGEAPPGKGWSSTGSFPYTFVLVNLPGFPVAGVSCGPDYEVEITPDTSAWPTP